MVLYVNTNHNYISLSTYSMLITLLFIDTFEMQNFQRIFSQLRTGAQTKSSIFSNPLMKDIKNSIKTEGPKRSFFSHVKNTESIIKNASSKKQNSLFNNLYAMGIRSMSTEKPTEKPTEKVSATDSASTSRQSVDGSDYWTSMQNQNQQQRNQLQQKLGGLGQKEIDEKNAQEDKKANVDSNSTKKNLTIEEAQAFWDSLSPEEKEYRLLRRQAKREKTIKTERSWDILYYAIATAFLCLCAGYLAVPLYAAFCSVTGFGGTVKREVDVTNLNDYMSRTAHISADAPPLRTVTVRFSSNVHSSMDWDFVPEQREIKLRIGDTALAFYRAKNNMSEPFTGVSTYNVIPPQAGLYFNKIQCFCFDEQRLRAGEDMDMPLFFFIDPAMADDWRLDGIENITLHYSFFPAADEGDDDDDKDLDDPVNYANASVPKNQVRASDQVSAKLAAQTAMENIETAIKNADKLVTELENDTNFDKFISAPQVVAATTATNTASS